MVLVVFEILDSGLDSGFSDMYVAILLDMIWTVFWVVVGIKELLVVVFLQTGTLLGMANMATLLFCLFKVGFGWVVGGVMIMAHVDSHQNTRLLGSFVPNQGHDF